MASATQLTDSPSFLTEATSRTAETTERYEKCAARLLANYQLETTENPSLPGYATWLTDRRSGMSPSSFRQYRAASIWVFGLILKGDSMNATVHAEVQRAIAILSSPLRNPMFLQPKVPLRTSALKQKRISSQDWEKLTAALSVSKRRHAEAVLLLLTAGLVTGLRPSEWINTRMIQDTEEGWKLKVQNGKSTNGRSHGPTRTLTWSDSTEEVQAIRDWQGHLSTCLPREKDRARAVWRTYYAQLRDTLHEVCQELWPRRQRRPTFYSTRHTFAAAAKALLTPSEVGALLGHGTDFTAAKHYARPPKGRSRLPGFMLPTPDFAEVLRVRQVLEERLNRATLLRAGYAEAHKLDEAFSDDHDGTATELADGLFVLRC
ncbi:site-specific integrase [Aurantimonas sp.]